MADNRKGLYELDDMIAKLKGLEGLPERAAPACADAVRESLERSISAGRAPNGTTWEPRKEDGQKPLQNAVEALTVVPVRKTVFARIKGPEARHHKGWGKGGTVRQILPKETLPPDMQKGLRDAIVETFQQTMGVK